MKVITLRREFGSGGRELGKRIAEAMGIAYYDKEILTAISKSSGLAEEYVKSIVEHSPINYYPITFGHTFSFINSYNENYIKILNIQDEVIKELASKSDCVIVGRCAEVILNQMPTFNLYVYADIESKLQRCRLKAPADENLTDNEIIKNIKDIEKSRKRSYTSLVGKDVGMENYHLCVNTSGKEIKSLVTPVVNYINAWYSEK